MKTQATQNVRPAAVAGLFYPDEPQILRNQIQTYLHQGTSSDIVPKAMIAPHAGYLYSGAIAAAAYKSLAPLSDKIRKVVLLGPAHREYLKGLATPSQDFFNTPLGKIPLDQDMLKTLQSRFDFVKSKDSAHSEEHSIEVHCPFLQVTLRDFQLLPILVGEASEKEVAHVLEAVWGNEQTLIVISSDLSHFHPYSKAQIIDHKTALAIERFDGAALDYESACGRNSIRGLLPLAKEIGLNIKRLDLRNSGDTAGSKDRVVGYGSWLLF